jgi:putative aminopeptidase FrvX
MHALVALGWTLAALAALAAQAAPGGERREAPRHGLPSLANFARRPAPVGHEARFLDDLVLALPPGAHWDRDAFGSLIVRLDGGPLRPAEGPGARTPRLLVAVGIDEPCFVVSRIRDDGWLRLRYLGDPPPGGDHLLREGRPARVWTRAAPRPGVVMVDSIHLRNPRPETLDESQLWLDVGADDAAGVARLGIELLDPVVQGEVVAFGLGAVAGPAIGRRAAAHALLSLLHELPRGAAEDVAFAFVAQSRPGAGPLGRGGEAVVRRLRPAAVLALDADADLDMASRRRDDSVDGLPFTTLALRVAHEDTPVETVEEADHAAFAAALRAELTGGPASTPPPDAPPPDAPPPEAPPPEGSR